MKDYKRIIYFMLLPVLLILSNLFAFRYTSLGGFPIEATIFLYPFTYLIILLLSEKFNKKDSHFAIMFSVIIQIVLLVIYELILILPIQDMDAYNVALYLIIKPNYQVLAGFIAAFAIGQFTSVTIYDKAKNKLHKYFTSFIALLVGLILDGIIYITIGSIGQYTISSFLVLIVTQLLVNVAVAIILSILFALLNRTKKTETHN